MVSVQHLGFPPQHLLKLLQTRFTSMSGCKQAAECVQLVIGFRVRETRNMSFVHLCVRIWISRIITVSFIPHNKE